jgi:hypothetical protein
MDLHETISKAACEPSIDQGVTKVFKTKFTFRFRLVRTLAQEMNIATKRTAIRRLHRTHGVVSIVSTRRFYWLSDSVPACCLRETPQKTDGTYDTWPRGRANDHVCAHVRVRVRRATTAGDEGEARMRTTLNGTRACEHADCGVWLDSSVFRGPNTDRRDVLWWPMTPKLFLPSFGLRTRY